MSLDLAELARLALAMNGKDYFTEEESALYACVSYAQFRAKAREYGLRSFTFMGKKVYRKSDLQRALEGAWLQSTGEDGPLTSTGGTSVASIGRALERSRRGRPRKSETQSGTNLPLANAS